jgi:hypothetical protein
VCVGGRREAFERETVQLRREKSDDIDIALDSMLGKDFAEFAAFVLSLFSTSVPGVA